MFERYTEKARRVIFFARYEASMFGSPLIETEHLLLGLLREDKALTTRLVGSRASVEAIRCQIEQSTPPREKISTSVDLPLSNESKRVLAYAAEEAERLSHQHIGSEHLALGLLREDKSLGAQLLTQRGATLSTLRNELQENVQTQNPRQPSRRWLGVRTQLGHYELSLKVADIDASLAFYISLGFHAAGGSKSDGIAVVGSGLCRIALYESRIAQNLLYFHGGDLFAIAAKVQAAGMSFEKPPLTGPDGYMAALLRDPDGNAIYLLSHPSEY
jgi:catechol 2,3-dioxygenase-like lactoylglutathione lyase family enzyme